MNKRVLQKFIADTGYCSRRKAEELIRAGRVRLGGDIAELGMQAAVGDLIEIDGKKIDLPKEKIYIIFNKPVGVTCTNRKFKNEKNVFAFLPKEFKGLHIVGRLDKDSRGLLILTNDGDFTLKATHPRFEHEKVYKIKVGSEKVEVGTDLIIKKLLDGIDIGEGDGIVRAKKVKYLGGNLLEIVLTEGKKRQIRRMFKALGYEVVDLKRTAIGEIMLGNLKEGEWHFIERKE